MTDRKTQRTETIRRILEAAADEFADTGYSGARVDRIAERANVNKATIYYHIGDKHALYSRVLHDVIGTTAARMQTDVAAADTPMEKIRAYIRSLGETVTGNPLMPRIMMRELASGGQGFPEVVVGDMATIIGLVQEVIEEGHRRGEFAAMDPLALHLMVIGGMSYGQAAVSVIKHHAERIDSLKGDENDVDMNGLTGHIERIVMKALAGDKGRVE